MTGVPDNCTHVPDGHVVLLHEPKPLHNLRVVKLAREGVLKKPEVTPGVAPVASEKPEVSLTAAMVAQAILKKPDRVEEDAMTGVEPSVSADPPPPRPPFPPPKPSVRGVLPCPTPLRSRV